MRDSQKDILRSGLSVLFGFRRASIDRSANFYAILFIECGIPSLYVLWLRNAFGYPPGLSAVHLILNRIDCIRGFAEYIENLRKYEQKYIFEYYNKMSRFIINFKTFVSR